jgi:hypothetical protein
MMYTSDMNREMMLFMCCKSVLYTFILTTLTTLTILTILTTLTTLMISIIFEGGHFMILITFIVSMIVGIITFVYNNTGIFNALNTDQIYFENMINNGE